MRAVLSFGAVGLSCHVRRGAELLVTCDTTSEARMDEWNDQIGATTFSHAAASPARAARIQAS